MAALVDESQMKTIEEYVESARQEGGDVFQPDINLPNGGYFYKPTLITNVSTVSRVVQEEIFGPIAVAMPFRTAKEAINLGNNTCYGLGSSVWSNSLPKTLEVAITLKAGAVWVNCHNQFDAAAGFGGYKVSFRSNRCFRAIDYHNAEFSDNGQIRAKLISRDDFGLKMKFFRFFSKTSSRIFNKI